MVNLLLGYVKTLDRGEVLRVTTWQEGDCVRLHFGWEARPSIGPRRSRQDEGLGSFWNRAQDFARSVSADLQMAASQLSADLRVPIRV
jgi:predicted TIM-barrel enzyme